MNPMILLALFTIVRAEVANISNIVYIRDLPHEVVVLKNDLHAPFHLAMDYEINTLFYSCDTEDDFSSESAYLNLKTSKSVVIRKLLGGFANAVDGNNHTVYIGARNGVYKYDYKTDSASLYGARGISVWQLFYKDNLYFTEYFTETAYVFTNKNGTFKEIPQLKGIKVLVLSIDKNDNIYFSNLNGLFKVKTEESSIYKVGNWNVSAFTTDIEGNLFFCTNSKLFILNNDKVILLASLRPVYGMAIDKNGEIIYSNTHQIIKLKPTVDYNSTSDYYRLLNIDFFRTSRALSKSLPKSV